MKQMTFAMIGCFDNGKKTRREHIAIGLWMVYHAYFESRAERWRIPDA